MTHVVAFHAQQCVEKCFKAVLEQQNHRVPKDHSTIRLSAMVKNFFDEILVEDILTDLDDLYIEARYPADLGFLPYGKPNKDDALQFLQFAEKIFARACQILDYRR